MTNVEISGDFFSLKDVGEFAATLEGVKFVKSDLIRAFSKIGEYICGANGEEIVEKMFA